MAKATLVQLELPPPASGQVMIKSGFVRQLDLRPGEVDAVRGRLRAEGTAARAQGTVVPDSLLELLASFERPALLSPPPPPGDFADVSVAALHAFGQAVVDLRRQGAERLDEVRAEGVRAVPSAEVGQGRQALHSAVVAVKALEVNAAVTPIGMLNLERLEMAPAGIERGELIATIPLAPLEETAVTHKEWSVQSKEFTSIVTDSMENTSETGVTDNTELAQSTTSQAQHSNQFNITGTVSGGIPVISGSSSAGFTAQDSRSQSATTSTKHATALTKKASARAKQEHKVTISTKTVTGSEESTTRKLRNPSPTDPVRIDYFSMMRKWRVRLYRHGLRLTYDLVVPEPGASLRKAHKELEDLKSQIGPFQFNVPHYAVTERVLEGESQPHYRVLAERYGAVVPDFPVPPPDPYFNVTADNTDGARIFTPPALDIPKGYWIKNLNLWFASESRTGDFNYNLKVLGSELPEFNEAQGSHGPIDLTTEENGRFLLHATGPVAISFRLVNNRQTWIKVVATLEEAKGQQARTAWQAEVWNALRDAAQTQYYERQQEIATKIAALEEKLASVDTLTLRREESDEVMKCVLRFLLGPDFDFMPQEVIDAFTAAGVDLAHGIGFDGNGLGLSALQWATVRKHEELVRLINQAIEWENVVTFLYSYFWDVPPSWDFVRQIQHPDATRQAFLRAGSARVVLTVRQGWEERWLAFAEGGFKDSDPPVEPDPRYLTIAQEIAAYDSRNYPGIPPANPGRSAVRLEESVYTTAAVAVTPGRPVNIKVESSAGFLVGAHVVIDVADERRIQESQVIIAIPDSTHIVVGALGRPHDGTAAPFPILQPGTKGALIAEWNEYTPSSGVDIALTSNLGTVS
ncbi:hypothetical protein HKK72_36125 [Actinomadura sp. HBU206391]|nr:hypothetical protein [Actinomadura sp. HBU206391]